VEAQLWTITKMASLECQEKLNGRVASLQRCTGSQVPSIGEDMPIGSARSITNNIGKSQKNVLNKDT